MPLNKETQTQTQSSFFSISFYFILFSSGAAKSAIRLVLFFLTITRSGRLAEIRWSVCISKSQRSYSLSEFFTPALVDALSLKFEQHVSSGHQEDSLAVLKNDFSSDFQAFVDHSKRSNNHWYLRYPDVSQLSWFSDKVQVFDPLFTFFDFLSVIRQDSNVHLILLLLL